MILSAKRFSVAVALLAINVAAPASAHIRPLGIHAPAHSTVVRVHQDWRDGGYTQRRNGHVHAPFTHVNNRTTDVDAPFAAVRTSRHGVWVRAPFVNLFVPK